MTRQSIHTPSSEQIPQPNPSPNRNPNPNPNPNTNPNPNPNPNPNQVSSYAEVSQASLAEARGLLLQSGASWCQVTDLALPTPSPPYP